jgi:hypothetical protein
LAHQARGNRDEMRTILKFHPLTSQQSKVGLVNQGRALQSVIRSLGLEVVVSQAPQLFIDQGDEGTEGFLVALRPLLQ